MTAQWETASCDWPKALNRICHDVDTEEYMYLLRLTLRCPYATRKVEQSTFALFSRFNVFELFSIQELNSGAYANSLSNTGRGNSFRGNKTRNAILVLRPCSRELASSVRKFICELSRLLDVADIDRSIRETVFITDRNRKNFKHRRFCALKTLVKTKPYPS